MTSITIPSSVTTIGENAFVNCSSLTNITIPSGVTNIGNGIFWNCSSLTSITIPSSVTTIEEKTFADCSSLVSVIIPPSVTSIPSGEFEDSDSVTIYGEADSYAEEYAYYEGLPFVRINTTKDVIHTVIFNANGGINLSANSKGVIENQQIGTLPTVTREGYVFKGWHTAVNGGVKVTQDTKVTQDMILYAQWEKKVITYTVTFNANGGTNLSTNSKSVIENQQIGTLPTATREGYIFKGWYTAANGGIKVTKDTKVIQDMTLYAQWEKKVIVISPTPISKTTITLSKNNYYYDTKAKKPIVTVKLGNVTLKEGVDYALNYKNNKNIGTASVSITGKGNYTGTITKTFTISAKKGTVFKSGAYIYKITGTSTVAFAGIKRLRSKR